MQEDKLELLNAIIQDDNKAFAERMKSSVRNLSFGKFPLLTIMYMYGSHKIIKEYREKLLTINNFEVLEEPLFLHQKFRSIAKRNLRLYNDDEFISPFEILLLKGDNIEFRRCYDTKQKLTSKEVLTPGQIEKLNKISKIVSGKGLDFTAKKFNLPKREFVGQRKQILFWSTIVCLVAIALSMVFQGYVVLDKINILRSSESVNNQNILHSVAEYGEVEKIKLIGDFEINVSKWKTLENLTKDIEGNNYTITLTNLNKMLFTEINSTISNTNFLIKGKVSSSIFKNVSTLGKLTNCNFIFEDVELSTEDNFTFITENNFGEFTNSTIKMSADIKATSSENNKSDYKYIQIFTLINYGLIENIEVTENINIAGVPTTSFNFATICGENAMLNKMPSGKINNLKIKDSKIVADTIDIFGVTTYNYSYIMSSEVFIDIDYISSSNVWVPNVSGVCSENNYQISEVKTGGSINIVATGLTSSILASGICNKNGNMISDCISSYDMKLKSVNSDGDSYVYCGGIICVNNYILSKCKFTGNIEIESKNTVYCGGVSATNSYSISKCISDAKIKIVDSSQGKSKVYCGGIVAYSRYYIVENASLNSYDIELADNIYLGGIIGQLYNIITQNIPENVADIYFRQTGYDIYGICCGLDTNGKVVMADNELSDIYSYADINILKEDKLYW